MALPLLVLGLLFVGMRVAYCKPVGDTHLQLRFADEDKAQIAAIAFSCL